MTAIEIEKVIELQRQGYGYKKIASETGISINTVKSFCRRHPLKVSTDGATFCLCCGEPLENTPGKKARKFCSDVCRMKWWNGHQSQVKRKAYYTFICKNCGKEFSAYGNNHRVFCSRFCASAYRSRRKK